MAIITYLHSLSSLVETWWHVVYDLHPVVLMVDLHHVLIFEAASNGYIIILSGWALLKGTLNLPASSAVRSEKSTKTNIAPKVGPPKIKVVSQTPSLGAIEMVMLVLGRVIIFYADFILYISLLLIYQFLSQRRTCTVFLNHCRWFSLVIKVCGYFQPKPKLTWFLSDYCTVVLQPESEKAI